VRRALLTLIVVGLIGAALSVEMTDEVLERAPPPREIEYFDDGLEEAIFAIEHGDRSVAPLLAQWLRWEEERPSIGPLEKRRQRMVRAVLHGMGELEGDQWSLEAERLLRDDPHACEDERSPTCWVLLAALLDLPPDPFGEEALVEPLEPPSLEVAEDLVQLSASPELLERGAAWVAASTDPSTRLVDAIARAPHAYHRRTWMAGQRGDPADALRYSSGSPGAVAAAALAIGETAGLELRLLVSGDLLVLETGVHRVGIGQCGTTVAPPGGEPLERQQVLDLARMDQAAGLLGTGEFERAIALTAPVRDPRLWPGMEPVHARLLAAQGLSLPGYVTRDPDSACRGPNWAVPEERSR